MIIRERGLLFPFGRHSGRTVRFSPEYPVERVDPDKQMLDQLAEKRQKQIELIESRLNANDSLSNDTFQRAYRLMQFVERLGVIPVPNMWLSKRKTQHRANATVEAIADSHIHRNVGSIAVIPVVSRREHAEGVDSMALALTKASKGSGIPLETPLDLIVAESFPAGKYGDVSMNANWVDEAISPVRAFDALTPSVGVLIVTNEASHQALIQSNVRAIETQEQGWDPNVFRPEVPNADAVATMRTINHDGIPVFSLLKSIDRS